MGFTNIKKQFKSRHQNAYAIVRAVHNARIENRDRKMYTDIVVHSGHVSVDAPLKMILVDSDSPRLNIILSSLSKRSLEENANFVLCATEYAIKSGIELRIISRNNLPNPNDYYEFLAKTNNKRLKKVSFYTDSINRVSSSTFRLEVSDKDVFFNERELRKLREFCL